MKTVAPLLALFVVTLGLAACGRSAPPSKPVPPRQIPPGGGAEPASTSSTTKRVVIVLSRPAGTDVQSTTLDGELAVALDIVENGRGPHVDATMRVAGNGIITSFSAKGHHELGTKIEESFRLDGGMVQWASKEEVGRRNLDKPAFYLPSAKMPDAIGLLAEALLKSGGKLALLPEGEAIIEKTGELTVKAGGKQKHIRGFVIRGLELAPTHVWMNDDGTWFGTFASWQSVVPEGWESVVDTVVAKQLEFDRAEDARVAAKVAHKPPTAGIAFVHARVLDVEKGRYASDQTVVVVGDTIRSVGPSAAAKVPASAEVVDLAGKTLLPGLWDMHSHLGRSDGVLDIASGVTTARDVGNDPDELDAYKKQFDAGTAVGPHVVRFGFIEGRGDKAAGSKVTAETEAEAKAAVETYAKRGYEGVKIYNSVRPELVPVIAKEAHARKMLVTGHIPVHMLANEAVRAGYDGIEHINMLFLNFFADHDTDTRTTTRFTLIGDKAASFDLKGKPATEFFALLKSHQTVIDPTVGVFESLLVGEQGKLVPGTEAMMARLPIQTRRGYLVGGLPFEGKKELYAASRDKLLAMLKALYDQKIPLVVGTDDLAGLWLHHELEIYEHAGIPAADALRMATVESARTLKLDAKTGTIAPGKTADLFVVDGDPLAHIADVGKVVTTMRGGVVFPSAKLYETVGVKPNAARPN
jgi:hypothetical protein